MVRKTFKLELFNVKAAEPVHWDWSDKDVGVRKLDITYEKRKKKGAYFCYVTVTRNTERECYAEFDGQLSDGFFENVPDENLGKVWEVVENADKEKGEEKS